MLNKLDFIIEKTSWIFMMGKQSFLVNVDIKISNILTTWIASRIIRVLNGNYLAIINVDIPLKDIV